MANKKVENFLYEELTYKIRGCAFVVYRELGNGHKEKVYQGALAEELKNKNIEFKKEFRIEVFYKNKKVGTYVPDMVIEDEIVLEIKAKPNLHRGDIQQFWQYLKGTKYRLGLLINFGSWPRVQIIRRIN
ncbi:MAG: GxxExxY protein [Patescibacteria group bacterium]|nr:GxxExxY protein [Patescibacteria group bacterium]